LSLKKEDLPQDKGALENFTKEVCYVTNKEGRYETSLSEGWNVKHLALNKAWQEIERKTEEARQNVLAGKVSPIAYYLELKLMDISILSSYTKFFKWQIKRHMKPAVFANLSDQKLLIYAQAFDVPVANLKNINVA